MIGGQNANALAPGAVRFRRGCDHCGGSFGMVMHRWWGRKFCKRSCKDAYLRGDHLDGDPVHRWCGLLGLGSRRRLPLQQNGGCVAVVRGRV